MNNTTIKNLVNLDTLTEKSALAGIKAACKAVKSNSFKIAIYARYLRNLDEKKYSYRALAVQFDMDAGNLNRAVSALETLEKYGKVDDVNGGALAFSPEKIGLADKVAGGKDKPEKADIDIFTNAVKMTRDDLRNVTGGKDGKDKGGKVEKMVTINKLIVGGKEYSGKLPESLYNQVLEYLTLKK